MRLTFMLFSLLYYVQGYIIPFAANHTERKSFVITPEFSHFVCTTEVCRKQSNNFPITM
jgi:Zn-dependent peptidase ImmA (M78 family)